MALLKKGDTASTSYGTWREKTQCGKTSVGMIRTSFLIDEKGKIAEAWHKVNPRNTVPKAIKALGK